jgi:hypothetical protein
MSFASELMARAHSMKARLDNIRKESEEAIGRAKAAVEVTAAAGGFAYVNGRYGADGTGADQHLAFVGVPADLGAAVALGGLGVLGAAGKYSEDAFHLGLGCLQSFVVRNLFSMGLTASVQKTTAGYHPHTAGALPYGNPYLSGAYAPHAYAQG